MPWNKGLTKADPRVAAAEDRRRANRVYDSPYKESGKAARQRRHATRLRERDPLGLVAREKRARCLAKRLGNYAEHVDYRLIVERDDWVCVICGLLVVADDLSFDHLIPLSRGGEHTHENIAVVHAVCNSSKGDRIDASRDR